MVVVSLVAMLPTGLFPGQAESGDAVRRGIIARRDKACASCLGGGGGQSYWDLIDGSLPFLYGYVVGSLDFNFLGKQMIFHWTHNQ